MWLLADSRGIIREDDVYGPLSLTHETLAQMIGARRPNISLGLKASATEAATAASRPPAGDAACSGRSRRG
jgi:hypothetical protein